MPSLVGMTTIYLIRHAERDTVSDQLPGRAPGIRLTAHGQRQAESVATELKRERITSVFSSPLERAVETAGPLARELKVPVQVSTALNEIDFGEWTGRRVSELVANARWRHFNQFRSGTRIPGGESALEVQSRMVNELLRLRETHPDQTVACVSHADPIRLALTYLLGMSLDQFDRLEIAPASISIVALADWGARLLLANWVPLP